MSQTAPDKKIANSLVALSSAAVLAVYSAGYFRTKAAADHLEALESRVRPGMAASRGEAPPSTLGAAVDRQAPVPVPTAPAEVEPPAPAIAKVDSPKLPAPAPAPKPAVEPSPAAAAPTTKPEIEAEVAEVHLPAPPAPIPPAPVPTQAAVNVPAPVPVAVVAPPPPPPPAPAQPTWKDGTYLGWGSARHGSIQASVEVTGGHIASAKIEQCAMRYSCNVIERLIPQVAQRGNPEKIDYISGATESSNVFYWALIDALSKAK